MKKWVLAILFLILCLFSMFAIPFLAEARSITFRWEMPGDPPDLGGFKFYTRLDGSSVQWQHIGTSPFDGNYVATYEDTITSPELDALPAGTYVFVATAYDTNDVESAHSNETDPHDLNGGPIFYPPSDVKGIRLTLTDDKDEHIIAYKIE